MSPGYVGPYKILQKIGKVAYELRLHSEFALLDSVFHVSMLNKCIGYRDSTLPIEGLGSQDNLSDEEIPIRIFYRQVKKLRNKEVTYIKVLGKNHLVEDATWEAEADMKSQNSHLFY